MAYSKQTWATGDTITAEKLNHMEDGIDNAQWLESNDAIELFNETVTKSGASATLQYNEPINIDSLNVVFNGTSYTCEKYSFGSDNLYGDTTGQYTEYPFCIASNTTTGVNTIYTNSNGECTISASGLVIAYTQTFTEAVTGLAENTNPFFIVNISYDTNQNKYVADKTFDEIMALCNHGQGYFSKPVIAILNEVGTVDVYTDCYANINDVYQIEFRPYRGGGGNYFVYTRSGIRQIESNS